MNLTTKDIDEAYIGGKRLTTDEPFEVFLFKGGMDNEKKDNQV